MASIVCFLSWTILIFNVEFIAQVKKRGDGGWTKLVDACMGMGRVTEVFGQCAVDRPGVGACP